MRVFFDSSLTGKQSYEKNYVAIVDRLKQLGHTLVANPVEEGDSHLVARETQQQAERYYKDLTKWIGSSDVAVFEVSYPSTGIGHEISVALYKGKPVIALYTKVAQKPYILESIVNDRLQVIEYQLDDLGALLKDALEYATEQQDVRFNFFVSPKIQQYLDWVAKYKRTPRAVYLRELLEKDMRENKDWKKSK